MQYSCAETVPNRTRFWRFCQRAAAGARHRSAKAGLPYNLHAYDLDEMLCNQNWKCAVTGQPFECEGQRNPFGPSLDRINPRLGYVRTNVRLVTNIVNMAMSNWGEKALWEMIRWAKVTETNRKSGE